MRTGNHLFLFLLFTRVYEAEGGACARCPLAETANGRLFLGDVAFYKVEGKERSGEEREREGDPRPTTTTTIVAPEYLSISPPDGAIPSL